MARMELGQYPEAVEDLDQAIRLDPSIPSPSPTGKPPPNWPGQRRPIVPAADRTATPCPGSPPAR